MADDPNDPLVKLSGGRVMRLSQFRAIQNQMLNTYTQQMTVAIEQLAGLSDELYGQSSDVYGVLYQLQSDLSGIEGAFGTDDMGTKFKAGWDQAWPAVQQMLTGVAKNVAAYAGGLSSAADTVFQSEQNTLAGFGRTAVNPRVPPPSSRGRGRAF